MQHTLAIWKYCFGQVNMYLQCLAAIFLKNGKSNGENARFYSENILYPITENLMLLLVEICKMLF